MDLANPFAQYDVCVVDIETYQNLFLVVFYDGERFQYFNIDRKNQLVEYLHDEKKILVGYNTIGFDDILLKALIAGKISSARDGYELAQRIIRREPDELIKRLQYRTPITWGRSVDLMALGFKDDDSGAGKASLKDIAIRLQCDKIQDLPYRFDSTLTQAQKQEVLRYCENDVIVAARLWNSLHEHVVLRYELEKIYGVNVFTHTNAQICETVFSQMYSQRMSVPRAQLLHYKSEINEIEIGALIPDFVHFQTDTLRDLQARLQRVTIAKRDEKWDKSPLSIKVEIGEKSYQFGAGGLHSEDRAGIFRSSPGRQIVDIDVTSYYPAIMMRCSFKPGHLTSQWTQILREITAQRVEAKRAGDKLVSDALKIVINSAFGKTGNQYSFMYDPRVLLAVTITGELSLLMLIEQLHLAGFEILSANTDGVTLFVEDDKRDKFDAICGDWQQETQFNLEETIYKQYVRQDVNNYLAETDKGQIKTKGLFAGHSLFKKTDALVISFALREYFVNGTAVEETIRAEENLHHFCYSYKTTRNFVTIYNGGQQLQKTNRWYYSLAGQPLAKKRVAGATSHTRIGQVTRIANGERAAIANEINGPLPTDIDYAHYINRAKEIIHRIEADQLAAKLREMGLAPIPKQAKRNPSGARLSEIKHDWDFGSYSGVGCYTGDTCGIIALDIDYPERFGICHLLTDTMTVWHGSGTRQAVQTGKKRGTLLYKCHNGLLNTVGGKFAKKHGFEIIYGKKPVQLFGLHTSGEEYVYDGELAEIPRELEIWLLENAPKKRVKRKKVDENTGDLFHDNEDQVDSPEYAEDDYEQLLLIAKEILPRWQFNAVNGDGIKLYGFCPFSDEHTGKSSASDFDICLKQGWQSPSVKCFHSSCRDSVQKLQDMVRFSWNAVRRKQQQAEIALIELPRKKPPSKEIKTIREALRSDCDHVVVEAPTGAGKTYESARYFIECLKKDRPVAYVASNKSELMQFKNHLEKLAGRTIEELRTHCLQGGEAVGDEVDAEGNIPVDKSHNGIITHHTYLKRKGISKIYFTFIWWMCVKSPVIIVDEADNFLSSLTYQITIGSRYKKKRSKGSDKDIYFQVSTCPAFSGSGNCSQCHYAQFQQYEVNSFNIPQIYTQHKVSEEEWNAAERRNKNYKRIDLPIINFTGESLLDGIQIRQIEKHPTAIREKEPRWAMKDGEVFCSKESIRDIIDSSYNPLVYKVFPRWKESGELIREPEKEITPENKHLVQFPYQPCRVPHISLMDQSPIEWIRRYSQKTVWFSACVGPTNKDFLRETLGDFREISIKTSNQKIDELLIIAVNKKIPIIEYSNKQRGIFFDKAEKFGKVLVFEPKKSDAQALFKRMPLDYSCGYYSEGAVRLLDEKYAEGKWKSLISYSRGPIGRGINMPEFATCFISSRIYKPAIAFNLKNFTADELRYRMMLDRWSIITQNAGRILRGNAGRKIIVVHSCGNEGLLDAGYLKEQFAPMVRREIQIAFFEKDTDAVKESLWKWHLAGQVVNNEKSEYERAKELSAASKTSVSSRLHSNRRKKFSASLEEEKAKRERQKKELRFKKLLQATKTHKGTWTRFKERHNINRLKRNGLISDEDIEQLKKLLKNKRL